MSTRERNLLVIFFLVLVSAGVVVGLSSYLQAIVRLDLEFVALQKHALRLTQTSLSTRDSGSVSSWGNLKERFFAPGTLPDPLSLASRAQSAIKASGLTILESRVTENTGTAQWVQYHAEGQIESWFRFLELVRGQDPKTLFRSMSLVKKQGFLYAVAFEVGHVVQN